MTVGYISKCSRPLTLSIHLVRHTSSNFFVCLSLERLALVVFDSASWRLGELLKKSDTLFVIPKISDTNQIWQHSTIQRFKR